MNNKVKTNTSTNEKSVITDLIEMDTSYALAKSVSESKTLAFMLVIGILLFGAFGLFLVSMTS